MTPGKLILMPNTLDFGVDLGSHEGLDLREVLPQRVIETAARLTHWAAENAKTTRSLLKRVDAIAPLIQPLQAMQIIELPRPPKGGRGGGDDAAAWLALLDPALAGHDLGLISEAGLPAVADPGARLVALAHAAGIEVVALAGPSSLLLALAASGLNGQSFAFVGYLPVDGAAVPDQEPELYVRRGLRCRGRPYSPGRDHPGAHGRAAPRPIRDQHRHLENPLPPKTEKGRSRSGRERLGRRG